LLLFSRFGSHRDLHSFPTRRSSDLGYSEVINSQITLGPKDIGEIRIFTPGGARVFLGADDSRQANELSYDTTFFKFAGNYFIGRSEEHTSELQSRENLVCRLLLEKK